jgi:hypothetical protein
MPKNDHLIDSRDNQKHWKNEHMGGYFRRQTSFNKEIINSWLSRDILLGIYRPIYRRQLLIDNGIGRNKSEKSYTE